MFSPCSLLSRLLFSWLTPFLSVGFTRPLGKDDFWELPISSLTDTLTERVEQAFYERCTPEERPAFVLAENGDTHNTGEVSRQTSNSTKQACAETSDERPVESANGLGPIDSKKKANSPGGSKPKYDSSLLKALHNVFWFQWWTAGVLKLCSDTLNTTTPLVNQVLLTWLTRSYICLRANEAERTALGLQKPQGIGYGIGLAFAIFAMQGWPPHRSSPPYHQMSNHYQMVAMSNGLRLRTSLIGAIFRKSLRLSGRARMKHSVGQITTMISTDATRLDRNSAMIHNLWVAPIQVRGPRIAIGVGLLIRNLGYSALVGLAILIVGFPIHFSLARMMFTQRKKGVVLTDQRVRMTTEVLSGIRLLKYYAWETFYAHQVNVLREREVSTIRRLAVARSALIGSVTVIPILASILSFITYGLTKHNLDVATIFSSLQFFNIIRQPLAYFPLVLAAATDALVALRRISTFLRAEELAVPYAIEPESKFALDVDADFTWETVRKGDGAPKFARGTGPDKRDGAAAEKDVRKDKAREKKGEDRNGRGGGRNQSSEKASGKEPHTPPDEEPFKLKDVRLKIPKGSFVAIVGRVGSGKSSLLQALIGEMRKTRGDCTFSSTAAYVPQASWIMNATLRQNVVFGQPDDDARFHEVIQACCLEPDLEMLPNGEETEIGEKGINLSGGQKARVSLARAAYSRADIVLMDDSLSAVDAYVGKQLLERCLLNGPLADRTRVLVTHALHVLDKTDYIYVMDEGVVVEQGTFQDIMANGQMFARLMEEYGSLEKQEEIIEPELVKEKSAAKVKDAGPPKERMALMQEEERLTGAVSWSVYAKYFKFSGGKTVLPMIVLWVCLSQGAQVANNLFLGFWTSQSIRGFAQGDYMGTYAGLGIANGIFSFALSMTISLASLTAGLRMFTAALMAVLRSPISFFDTTPMGRIMSRLSKDQDTVDAELAMQAMQLLTTASSVIGTAALVFYTFPYLGIIFVPLLILYYMAAVYYRRTSVEAKRLDSLLRSSLYSAYSGAFTLFSALCATEGSLRCDRFVNKSEQGLDQENRAYYMTLAIQRWNSVDPSKIGVVLSYTLSTLLVSTYAQNEQNFNAVERILYYTELPSEGASTTPNDPPESWPESGEVKFTDVEMAYRPGLPAVLKGVSFNVRPGEKVGIVGRTGAGKSSLLQALFRIVNVQAGRIEIDGRNTAEIGLDVLRGRLALVPQDSLLFKGTLRENLDPTTTRTDAELIDALRRAWLLPRDGPPDPVAEAKFSLNSNVSDEGSNYSAGEKQLLALCRALVKNSRIIVLDEATSSVDVETDAKVQRTIQTEFAASTLLCIAHRLNTIGMSPVLQLAPHPRPFPKFLPARRTGITDRWPSSTRR
ncbi:multidrug resistance-associated ABC transporter [Trametes elegans]|nr:multidrug resistance-associated ABC transporter [Trametes elegans]